LASEELFSESLPFLDLQIRKIYESEDDRDPHYDDDGFETKYILQLITAASFRDGLVGAPQQPLLFGDV